MAFASTYQPRKTPYQLGLEDGRDGVPLQHYRGPAGIAYRDGWYVGYHEALTRDVRAYNAAHGTNYEPRGPY